MVDFFHQVPVSPVKRGAKSREMFREDAGCRAIQARSYWWCQKGQRTESVGCGLPRFIQVVGWGGAWKPLPSRRDGGVRLRRTLTALRQGSMMVLGVGAAAEGTEGTRGKTSRLWVAPESASSTKGNARVDMSRRNCPGHPCHGDGAVGEMTRSGAGLGVPDIEVNAASVSSPRIANDARRGSKPDEVQMDR